MFCRRRGFAPFLPLLMLVAPPVHAAGFTEVAHQAGLVHAYRGWQGGGVAVEDFDQDGDMDVALAGGWFQSNRLFENVGDPAGTGIPSFVDVTETAGLTDIGHTKGVVFADADNDGFPDLFFFTANNDPQNLVTPAAYVSPIMMYHNNGDGTFTEATADAGLLLPWNNQVYGSALADVDNDGWLDLVAADYGFPPAGGKDFLLHNRGDGTFEDVSAASGVGSTDRVTLQSGFLDYDGDGDQDIYCAVDHEGGNTLYRNEGGLRFTDVSDLSGTGLRMYGMCVAAGDCDNDGDPDLFVTNESMGNAFLVNNGNGTFTESAGTAGVLGYRLGWGAAWIDCDNDGLEDLYTTAAGSPSQNQLFHNNGDGTFTDVAPALGCADPSDSYGLAYGDLNLDGNLDLLVANQNSDLSLYLNDGSGYPSLSVRLLGIQSNADAVGARLSLVQPSRIQFREITAGDSYLSQHQKEAVFGLGGDPAEQQDLRLDIRWPSGLTQSVSGLEAGGRYRVVEGVGIQEGTVLLDRAVTVEQGTARLEWETVPWPEEPESVIRRRDLGDAAAAPVQVARLDTRGRLHAFADAGFGGLPHGLFRYEVSVVDRSGAERPLWNSEPLEAGAAPAPVRLVLGRNYPNPFSDRTHIPVQVPETVTAPSVRIFDAAGRLVSRFNVTPGASTLLDVDRGALAAGGPPASGIYYTRIFSGNRPLPGTLKMLLLP